MRKEILGSLASLFVGAGLALAQPAEPSLPVGPVAPIIAMPGNVEEAPWLSPNGSPGCCDANVPRVWFGTDYLLWWIKDQPLSPPLLTTGPAAAGPLNAGAVGIPGTVPLSQNLSYGSVNGIRFNAGGWLNNDRTIGIEASAFLLEQAAAGFSALSPNGATVISTPFGPPGPGSAGLISFPGIITNAAAAVTSTSQLWGAEVNALSNVIRNDLWTVNMLGGFRYVDLDEKLDLLASGQTLVPTPIFPFPGVFPPGSIATRHDHWATRNQFYGGQLGGKIERRFGRWFINGTGKVALGDTHQATTINGLFTAQAPGAGVLTSGGGFHTTPSNIGRFTQDSFSVIPDLQANIGYDLTPNIRATLGYNFMYWGNVVRPGNQVDINRVPVVPQAQSDFWAHGLNVGLTFRY